ncbi:ribonuclease P protein component [Marivirga atlantica]|jgi:ribonuclease P protein component|uniref:Ribonuclease P protein component n=1 Tax=Marivirga atlantica TaxID=1548457 RepID=A0A937ADF5_9BACT|nr:ribonuclease P protein component [Marivirga atlantica]MBL0763614.1 ribonuclease P protein component [Marivirga atlantica]
MSAASSDNLSKHPFSFKKEERLKSKKLIQELFSEGSSFYLYPFKVIWAVQSNSSDSVSKHKILISVPKRKFKRAVDRNSVKRRVREAYRLNKAIISPEEVNKTFHIAYIYTADKILPQSVISKKLIATLGRLKQNLDN